MTTVDNRVSLSTEHEYRLNSDILFEVVTDSEKKRKKVRKKSYSLYFANLFSAILVDGPYLITMLVLKQVHPDMGISNKVMAILNSFINDVLVWGPLVSFFFYLLVTILFTHFFLFLQSLLLTQSNPPSPPIKSRPPSDSFFLMNLPSMLSLRVQVSYKYVA
jgi:hypothetical protein